MTQCDYIIVKRITIKQQKALEYIPYQNMECLNAFKDSVFYNIVKKAIKIKTIFPTKIGNRSIYNFLIHCAK